MTALDILYEDNHLLVVNKPAMLPTMGVRGDRPTLLAVAKEYVKHKYDKPGNVYLGVVSRLDAPVTGVILLARTSKAAARLSAQFRVRSVEKVYLAAVSGDVEPPDGELVHWLRKDERHRKVAAVPETVAGAQVARLHYRTRNKATAHTVLEVRPITGRKHQIRVQLAAIGHPVLGDRKYGSQKIVEPGIALHSHRLCVEHPTTRVPLKFEAPLPDSWRVAKINMLPTK